MLAYILRATAVFHRIVAATLAVAFSTVPVGSAGAQSPVDTTVGAPVNTTSPLAPDRFVQHEALVRRRRRAAAGTAMGVVLLLGSVSGAGAAGLAANPWCFDLAFEGFDSTPCTPPPPATGAVIGFSVLSAVSGLAGLVLVIGEPIRIHRTRRELRRIGGFGLGFFGTGARTGTRGVSFSGVF